MTVDPLDPLRLALGVSPDNLPLRRHHAEALLERGHLDEAEEVYRDGLAMAPADRPLRLGLASTFFRQGKHDQAMVLVEALLEEPEPAPRAFLLAARFLLVTDNTNLAILEPGDVGWDFARPSGLESWSRHRRSPNKRSRWWPTTGTAWRGTIRLRSQRSTWLSGRRSPSPTSAAWTK